jgi:glycosyltransferase involved in cell wall biosynthesis
MRLVLVVPGGVDRTGEVKVIPALLALIERLSRRHDVQVIALRQEERPDRWPLAGAYIHNIGVPRTRLRALHRVYALHRARPVDVIHAFFSGSAGLVAALAGKTLGIPSLVHVAGGELVALADIAYGGAQSWRGRMRERLVLRTASAVTAASAPIIQSLDRLHIAAQRVALGVDLKSWPVRHPVPRDPHRPARLIHVASLNAVKDQSTLLRALHRLMQTGVQFELDLVGEDTLHGEIQKLARQLGLTQRIRFRGFLTQKALRPLLEAADLMVLSSRHEAGPLVVLEAAIAGVPTVGTAVGHILEWAPDAALSVPLGDWAALAATIAHVLANEPLRLRIAHEALARAVKEDADHTAQCFNELYARLTSVSGNVWRRRAQRQRRSSSMR